MASAPPSLSLWPRPAPASLFTAPALLPKPRRPRSQALGVESAALVGDVGDAAVCARLVAETVQHFGTIDILVNNAGIIRRAPAVDYSEEDWKAVIDVNLNSVFRLMQHAGRHMLKRGSGKIINIASLLTFQGGILVPAYAAAKGGVGQLTKAFANEWAAKGVNVNAIAPGYMDTDNTEALKKMPSARGKSSSAFPPAAGAILTTSPVLRSFLLPAPAITFTVMCS